ncbi:MAG: transglycosylase SLT domain-containing protein [Prevotella sp.]|nr:transglycosylase SLT domain-containing protein [Prevotella sp.]MBR3080602.1 transglycosylase SLT domain-containing protein [Prevotella sp.]
MHGALCIISYLCTQNRAKLKIKSIFIHSIALLLFAACDSKKPAPVITPWGQITDTIPVSDEFDLDDIQRNGELIALTMTGPETYYDYHGRHLGTQYMLAQRFADKIGVSLRMEVCRDSAEMLRRLDDGEADLICYPMTKKGIGWLVGSDKDELKRELSQWYKPEFVDEVKKEEEFLLSNKSVTRRVFSPMLNRDGGIISHYDGYFQRYASTIRWDWRLMAAQCYQESTFDPEARSWAGACGLMQIMPSTADHLGLPRANIFNPEQNIAAAAKYLGELEHNFSDIRERSERTKFVLAAYNGGHFHIRDAMTLAQKHGKNPHRWADVEEFVLGLARPEYYNDPDVKYGYMRGSETVDYVRKIHERWNGYRGVRASRSSIAPSTTPQKATHERKKKYQINESD